VRGEGALACCARALAAAFARPALGAS